MAVKKWIAGAVSHPGAETEAAKRAGMSVHAYAEKHKHDPGTAGKRARLALTFEAMHHEGERKKAARKAAGKPERAAHRVYPHLD